jgi:hypothetical protein
MRIMFMNECQCGDVAFVGFCLNNDRFQISNFDLRRAWPRVWDKDISLNITR